MNDVKELEIEVQLMSKTAKLPVSGSEDSAGYDLAADIEEEIIINPHDSVKIGTGLAMAVPSGYGMLVVPRSGIADRQGLRPSNTPGLIDPDYTGEIFVSVRNDTDYPQTVIPQERIAQFFIVEMPRLEFTIVDKLKKTRRGDKGFGSTGLK